MDDELLDHYREYGKPQEPCDYTTREDGTTAVRSMSNAACLSDFSDLAFFVEPKEKPKREWKKHRP